MAKKKRDHVPALKGKALTNALRAIELLPFGAGARQDLQAIVLEAATPDRHNPQRLPVATARRIRRTQQAISDHSDAITQRVKALAALDLDDDAWMDEVERQINDQAAASAEPALPDDG